MQLLPSYIKYKDHVEAKILLATSARVAYFGAIQILRNEVTYHDPLQAADLPRMLRNILALAEKVDAARAKLIAATADDYNTFVNDSQQYLAAEKPPAPPPKTPYEKIQSMRFIGLWFFASFLLYIWMDPKTDFTMFLLGLAALVGGFYAAGVVALAVDKVSSAIHEVKDEARREKVGAAEAASWQARYDATQAALFTLCAEAADKYTEIRQVPAAEEAQLTKEVNEFIAALRESAKSGL